MCGLAAYIPNKKQRIDLVRFKSLLLHNEIRGKVSTGLWNKNGLIKSLDGAAIFGKNLPWRDLGRNSIFLGHTRQPTNGYPTTMEGAQPLEADNIVLQHNGTIYNKNALAKKYNVIVEEGDTDSMIMCKILNTKQFGVLNDYNGAATLLFVYKDDPTRLYFFRGESKKTIHVAHQSEERPLFMLRTREGLYFSSLDYSLTNISIDGVEQESIEEIDENNLFSVQKDDLHTFTIEYEADRSKMIQSKVVEHTHVSNYREHRNLNYNRKREQDLPNALDRCRSYPDYDMDELEYDPVTKQFELPAHPLPNRGYGDSQSLTKSYKELAIEALCNESKNSWEGPEIFNNVENDIEIEEPNRNMFDSNVVYYNKGRYFVAGIPINGTFRMNGDGVIGEKPNSSFYTFISGILLQRRHASSYGKIINSIMQKKYEFGDLDFAKEISLYSKQPIPYYNTDYYGITFCSKLTDEYDGLYAPLFLNRGVYSFALGEFVGSHTDDSYIKDESPFKKDGDDILLPNDIIVSKFNKRVIVDTVNEYGFSGHIIGQERVMGYKFDDIVQIEPRDEDSPTDSTDEEEFVAEVALEINEQLVGYMQTLDELSPCSDADKLSANIEEFINTKL